MAVSFPTSPSSGDTFDVGRVRYEWSGSAWKQVSSQPVSTGAEIPFTKSDGTTSDPIKLASTVIGDALVNDTTPQLGGSLDVNGNAIVSTSNANISITPNGSGNIILDGITFPNADGSANQILKTNGSGVLSWAADSGGIASVVADTTPQLGGNLDVNGQSIVSDASNENIPITPHGTGSVVISKADINGGAIDGTAIGAASASTGAFTTIGASGAVTVAANLSAYVVSLDSISSRTGAGVAVSLGTDADDDFAVAGTKFVVEGDTGNVGIGKTPTKKLQVKVDGGTNDGLSFVTDGDHTTQEYFCIGGGTPSGYSAQMRFMRGGTDGFTAESARFNTSGFLGINNTAPNTFLHVTETGSVGQHTTYIEKSNASAAGNVAYWSVNRADSTAYNFLSAANSGGQSFLLNGDGSGKADSTWVDNVYDYAEYFESASGEASELGRSVVLDDGKMRYYDASTDDALNIIGTTRPKKNAKGPSSHGSAWNQWHDRFLTDEFGQYEMEDVTVWSWDKIDAVEASEAVEAVEGREEGGVYERDELAKDPDWTPPADATSSTQSVRKQNPDYDPALADDYKSREDRDEWWLIGLLGQVQIKSDETKHPRWIKMRQISDAVDMWMIR